MPGHGGRQNIKCAGPASKRPTRADASFARAARLRDTGAGNTFACRGLQGDDLPLRLIEVFAAPGHMDTIAAIAQHYAPLDCRKEPASSDGSEACRIIARPKKPQELIDRIQGALGKEKPWRITIMPIEATIPELEQPEPEKHSPEQATREDLYAEIDRRAADRFASIYDLRRRSRSARRNPGKAPIANPDSNETTSVTRGLA